MTRDVIPGFRNTAHSRRLTPHPGARNEQRAKLGVHAPRCLMDHKADGIKREKLMHSVSVRIIFGNNPNTEDYTGKKEILVVVGDGGAYIFYIVL